MSKYGSIISEARKPENQKIGKPENTIVNDRDVNLSIKVAESRRRHWVAEAKRQGTTITAAISGALSERFGEPNNQ
jgi:hypothetical protein